jgi:hypothetical protein
MTFRGKATVRGKGFAIGIQVVDDIYASEVGETCRENGLLVSAEEDVLMLFPAPPSPAKPPSADSTSSKSPSNPRSSRGPKSGHV